MALPTQLVLLKQHQHLLQSGNALGSTGVSQGVYKYVDLATLLPKPYTQVVILTCLLTQPKPYSPPIIPVISCVICHPFFPVNFLSFILYSPLSTPIFVHLFSDYSLSFNSSYTTPFPHRLFPVIYKLAVNFTPNFFQSNPSHFQTHIIVCENLMKNDKYNGSLRSRDNRWGEGFGLGQKSGYYHYLYTFS